VQKHVPEVAAHMKKKGVFPDAYCQKWFVSLTVNVLPYRAMYRFIEHFLTQGYLYSFKFGLAFVSTFKDKLLKAQDHEIFSILRYDKNLPKGYEITDDTMYDIVERAATFPLVDFRFDIKAVREQVFKQYLEPRLLRAKAEQEKNESEDSDTEEEGAECDLCEENAPDMWCLDCKKMVCEKCHSKNAGGHKKSHKVDEKWEKYENKNDDD